MRRCSRAAREVFRNAARYYADLLSTSQDGRAALLETSSSTIEGVHYLSEAQESGRGGVVVSGHFGNPEIGDAGDGRQGVQGLQPDGAAAAAGALATSRCGCARGTGTSICRSDSAAMKEAIVRLKSGGIVALLLRPRHRWQRRCRWSFAAR